MNSKATGQTLPMNTDIYFAVGECYLGKILVARNIKGICAISLGNEPDKLTRELQDHFPNASLIRDDDLREQLVAKVVSVLENPDRDLQLPLDIQGTAFQKRVWDSPAGHSGRNNGQLYRYCRKNRCSQIGQGRGRSLWRQPPCGCHSLSSGCSQRWQSFRLSVGNRT